MRSAAPHGVRQFASIPLPLTVRMDGLMAKVTIAALIFFVPLDGAIFGLMLMNGRATSKGFNIPKKHDDVSAAFEEWKARKGISNYVIHKSGGKFKVTKSLE